VSRNVCLLADTLGFMSGGGHFWVYLNWALGLRASGVNVVWLESAPDQVDDDEVRRRVAVLRERLQALGFDGAVSLVGWTRDDPDVAPPPGCLPFGDVAAAADLLVNFTYAMPSRVLDRFRRTALIDIDPGLTQLWLSKGQVSLSQHTLYFTTGETVGQGLIPDCGLPWIYTPPCVSLDAWPVTTAADDAPFTTVSGWHANEWVTTGDGYYANDKRHGFLPFLELPRRTSQPLELALNLSRWDDGEAEKRELESLGWKIRHAYDVAGSPAAYRQYVQASRGEFSAAKPSCVELQNAWISDRTLCYLASGKPAVVRHTGPSRILPTRAGLFRFQTLQEAAAMLDEVAGGYERQCRLARELAVEHFDARRVAGRLLERAL